MRASGVCAGTMESSSGKATVTPTPRRNVRRGKMFFRDESHGSSSCGSGLGLLHSHLKWIALHNALDERRKTIVVLGGIPGDGANRRHVVVLERAAGRVGQQFFGHGADEHVRSAQQRISQTRRTVELGAVHKLSGGVDRLAAVGGAPGPDQIEVVERESDRIHDFVARRAGWILAMLFHALRAAKWVVECLRPL